MRRVLRTAIFLLPYLQCGCESGRIDPISLVNDLRIMGMKAEPAQIYPGEDIEIKVLWADPNGSGREVWFAWSVLFMLCDNEGCQAVEQLPSVVVGTGESGARLLIPGFVTQHFAQSQKLLEVNSTVYLCAGGHVPVADKVDSVADFDDLCQGDSFWGIKSVSAFDAEYPQNNPTIERFRIGDEEVSLSGAGDPVEILCETTPCLTGIPLELYMDESSFENCLVETNQGIFNIQKEHIDVAWYCTGGELDFNYGITIDAEEPMRNNWSVSEKGSYTLWAVVNDSRGGSDWIAYEVVVK